MLRNPALLAKEAPAIVACFSLPHPWRCSGTSYITVGRLKRGEPGALGVMLTSSATAARAASRVACVRGWPLSAASTRRAMMVLGATPPYATRASSTVHSPANHNKLLSIFETPETLGPNPKTIESACHDGLAGGAPVRPLLLLRRPLTCPSHKVMHWLGPVNAIRLFRTQTPGPCSEWLCHLCNAHAWTRVQQIQ